MSTHRVPHSSHWGAFEAHVRDGEVVEVTPYLDDPEPAGFLRSIPDGVRSPLRIAAPAVRRGWLEHGPGATPRRRGDEEFVEVDWNTALDLVAGELARVRRDHGNAAVFGGSYGWSSAGRFHHAKTQVNRFLGCFGGYTGQVGNYSYAAAIQVLPHILGDYATASGLNTSWDVITANTELWVMLGGGGGRTSQVEAGGVVRHETAHQLRAVADAGTEFVLVSPLRDDLPEGVDATWLPIRPNTDTALLLALGHTLLVEDRHDEAFLERCCAGWPIFRDYLLGVPDGVPKDAEWAAAICQLPAEGIRDLAGRMASSRTMISASWSLQRGEHGEQPFWAVIALAAMLGQIGLPGGGFGFAYGNASTIGSRRQPFGGPSLSSGRNPADSWIPVARIADMMLSPGGVYDFDGERRRYPDIRLVYWAGGNPFHHHQDLNRLAEAWTRPETIVVHEPYWTATARRADIVLPATITLERNDIGASPRDRFVVAMHQAVPPYAAARDDFAIFSALAERLGFAKQFTEGRDEAAWLRHLYAEMRERAAAAGTQLPRFEEFWENGHIELPRRTGLVLLEDFRRDPEGHPLATPSGLIEVFSETVAAFGYDDCPGHPAWIPPGDWLGAPEARRFPFHLMSNQPRTRLHSQLDMGRDSVESKVAGREPCRLNPADAIKRGISDGDVVRIFNDRGACLAGAILDDAVRRQVVQLSTGAWYDPVSTGEPGALDAHGNPNMLTPDRGTSRLAQGPSAHSALVDVEKYAGSLPAITVHTPPRVIDAETYQPHEPTSEELS